MRSFFELKISNTLGVKNATDDESRLASPCSHTLGVGPAVGADQPTTDSLSSWNDGAAKQAIVAFVAKVTKQGAPDFVPPAEPIATFDNDGTLWCEQPMYVQMAFALDRVKELAPKNPEWKNKQPFKAILERDLKALASQGEKGLVQLVAATHAGMSSEEFNRIASGWIASARHPKLKRPYTETVYQPMLELLAYLRANGFKTFIVSGGGVDQDHYNPNTRAHGHRRP